MQGTLLEDCAAKFYQKYNHTNIPNFGSIYLFLLINLTAVIVKFNKSSCVLCQCQNVMLVTKV